jgi:lipoprotein-releasing system permease protein
MEESVSGIEVRLHDLNKAPKIAGEILDTLKGDFYAQPWSETNRAFFEAIKLERRVYFIVLLLIVVMASFSIVGALVMVVVEKRRDIGVLRTLGATARDIALIFRIQGGVIGGVGVTLGTLGGLGLCLALKQYGFPIDERIFQMSKLPIYIDPLNFLSVAGSALVICAVATYYPARKASRLLPSEVLRYE